VKHQTGPSSGDELERRTRYGPSAKLSPESGHRQSASSEMVDTIHDGRTKSVRVKASFKQAPCSDITLCNRYQ